MSKEEKILPKLRFPEFEKDGEWEVKQLNKVCDVNPSNTDLPDEFVYIDLESVDSGKLLKKNIVNIQKAPSRAQRLLENDDIIYQMVRPYQKNNFFFNSDDEFNYVASTGYALLRGYQSKMYLYQYVHSDNFVNRVLSKCTGSNYPAINSGDLSRIKVEIPKPQEQQKIASCLSSLDELITAHNDKLDTLKNHKKGLMQNLFPQEGQKVPNYRFSEFEKDMEWMKKTLDQLGELVNGLTYSPKDVRREGLLVLRSSNIQNGIIDFNDCVYVRPNVKGANLSQPKDILVCVRNGSKRLIGKNAIIPHNIPMATHGAFMTVFRANYPEFVFQLFQSDAYNKQVNADLGATINSINGKNFIKYEFAIPENLKEQQKIASCLSAVDKLITAQSEKTKQLQQHKKGLMQGLFPKIAN